MPRLKPFVSIIIPVYNTERYLEECLDSIIAQHCGGYEIICADDCSTDGSPGIMRRYAKKYPFVKIIANEKNKGQSACRNQSVFYASGEYIMFLDSDDFLAPGSLKGLFAHLKKYKPDFAVVAFDYLTDGKIITGCLNLRNFAQTKTLYRSLEEISFWDIEQIAWNRVFKRSYWINKYMYFLPRFDGLLLNWKAFLEADTFSLYKDSVYIYRENRPGNTSVTDSKTERAAHNLILMFKIAQDYLMQSGNYEKYGVYWENSFIEGMLLSFSRLSPCYHKKYLKTANSEIRKLTYLKNRTIVKNAQGKYIQTQKKYKLLIALKRVLFCLLFFLKNTSG